MPLLPPDTGEKLMNRINLLAEISESSDGLTRRFATPEHRLANATVGGWMRECGMAVEEDVIGNIVGRYAAADEPEAADRQAPAIMLGSHLDTVVMAGKYDGMLGVLSGIACVEYLHETQQRLPFAVEVIGFADEEGVRYQSTFLGSKALTGDLADSELDRLDKDGISMREALLAFGKDPSQLATAKRKTGDIHAYLELHIEQGPVLERENLAVGVVTGIAGATRLNINLSGVAGHAGTVPMSMRNDAMAAAAECIVAVEQQCLSSDGIVGTVGQIQCNPGAINVIPGFTSFSIDLRSADDHKRITAVDSLIDSITAIAARRSIECEVELLHQENSVLCDPALIKLLGKAIENTGHRLLQLPSGAGHDAAAMASTAPVGMLFVRCEGGISHNPAESVTLEDAAIGAETLLQSVLELCANNTAP